MRKKALLIITLLCAVAEGAWAWSGEGTADAPYLIESTADWATFAANVNAGTGADKCYKLSNSWNNAGNAVTATVGEEGNPFKGTFDGNGKTLHVNISETSTHGTAPFRNIQGATIKNLTVEGSVTGTTHAAGLVGIVRAGGTSTVSSCVVKTTVNCSVGKDNYIGGVVGHGTTATLTIENTVFSGYLNNTADYAAGFVGWSGNITLTIINSFFTGGHAGKSLFHPIALHGDGDSSTFIGEGAYYISTVVPTTAVSDSKITAAGCKAYTDGPVEGTYTQLTAVDGQKYYVETIPYIERSWDNVKKNVKTETKEKILANCVTLSGEHPNDWIVLGAKDDQDHWYVSQGNVKYKVLVIYGNVHLILRDGTELDVVHVKLEEGNKLNVYGQSDEESTRGKLTATNSVDGDYVYKGAAAIGGGNQACMGSLYVHSGYVAANQTKNTTGAGIGGDDERWIAGEVVVYGGFVKSQNAFDGAGIGGGRNSRQGGPVTIYGGTVEASSTSTGAGIGGGLTGAGGYVFIYGGNVFAQGGYYPGQIGESPSFDGSGIGGGKLGDGGNVYLYGGTTKAIGASWNSAIGGSYFYNNVPGTLVITAGLRVTTKQGIASASERIETCRLGNDQFDRDLNLTISPCNHEGATFTYSINDMAYHTKYCPYCNAAFKEQHTGTTCLCGQDNTRTFTLYVPDTEKGGYKELESYQVGVGNEFYLPECDVVPKGYTFKGWEMNPDPTTLDRYAAVKGGDEDADINMPAGSSVKSLAFQNSATFYARYLYEFVDFWNWMEDGSDVLLTLHCDAIETDEHYTPKGGVTISQPEDMTDDKGNVYGQRYVARFTFTRNGYEYKVGSLYNATNRLPLADGSNNDAAIAQAVGKTMERVTLEGHTLYLDGSWNTLCLPFDIPLGFDSNLLNNPCDMRVLTSTSYENGMLTLNFTNQGEVPAGTPFILKWENDGRGNIKNPYFEYVTIPSNVEAGKSPTTYADFIGSFSPVSLKANDKTVLYLGADNKFYYPSANMTVGSCRAIFILNGLTAGEKADARQFMLNFGDDETTSISPTSQSLPTMERSGYYTLDGRRLSGKPTQKGLYIYITVRKRSLSNKLQTMKKQYSKPFVTTETIETELQFLAGSIVSSIRGGDTDIIYDGGGSVPARSREFDELADGIGELGNLLISE